MAILGMFVPARTSATTIKLLNQKIAQVLNSAEVKQKFFNIGTKVVASSPEELTEAMKSEMTTFGKVIKDAGIRAD